MKKSAISIIAAMLLSAVLPVAHAATAIGDIPVSITLTPKCEVESRNDTTTAATLGGLAFTYTSFQTADATASTTFNVRCTTSLGYSLGLDSTAVTDSTTALAYTVSFSSSSVSGTLGSQTGSGGNQAVTVYGKIASGQSGTCAGPSGTTCSNTASPSAEKVRRVTVTY